MATKTQGKARQRSASFMNTDQNRRNNGHGKMEPRKSISILGTRVHNLKNISVELPRDQLVVVTGVSGSGKSSLAFDTVYAEGQRRYMESLSSFARRFIAQVEKPDVDFVHGLSPVVSIEQKTIARNPRPTVGHSLTFRAISICFMPR